MVSLCPPTKARICSNQFVISMSRPLRRLSPPQNQAQAVQQQHGQLANDEELAEELEGGNGQRGYPMQDLPPRYEEPPPEYEDPPPYAP